MPSRLSHGVATLWDDAGSGVGDVVVPLQEFGARHFLRQRFGESLKLGRRQIREVLPAPGGFRRDDTQPHECGGPYRSVIGSGNRMADTRIDAVESVAGRHVHVSLDRARLAAQLQQFAFLAARARHLIHNSAGRADYLVLDALAQRRQLRSTDLDAAARCDRRCNGDLESGGRGDASPLRDRGVDENSHTPPSGRGGARPQCLHDRRGQCMRLGGEGDLGDVDDGEKAGDRGRAQDAKVCPPPALSALCCGPDRGDEPCAIIIGINIFGPLQCRADCGWTNALVEHASGSSRTRAPL